MKNGKTAIVIGATGLVGKQLVSQLIADDLFSKITLLVRRSTQISNDKVNEIIVDFDHLEAVSSAINGDVLFSCMGTTIKKAKTQENQYKVDFTYQYETAKIAAENGVATYVLVSSAGADAKSKVFYSRIKGELEDAVTKLSFTTLRILQPSILLGTRDEFRLGEKLGTYFMAAFKYIPFLRKYRGIKDTEVAAAMIALSQTHSQKRIIVKTLDELFHL